MLNGNHLVSQVEAETLARGVPDQELVPVQGCVTECDTYWFSKSCPDLVSRGSLSVVLGLFRSIYRSGANPEKVFHIR